MPTVALCWTSQLVPLILHPPTFYPKHQFSFCVIPSLPLSICTASSWKFVFKFIQFVPKMQKKTRANTLSTWSDIRNDSDPLFVQHLSHLRVIEFRNIIWLAFCLLKAQKLISKSLLPANQLHATITHFACSSILYALNWITEGRHISAYKTCSPDLKGNTCRPVYVYKTALMTFVTSNVAGCMMTPSCRLISKKEQWWAICLDLCRCIASPLHMLRTVA